MPIQAFSYVWLFLKWSADEAEFGRCVEVDREELEAAATTSKPNSVHNGVFS